MRSYFIYLLLAYGMLIMLFLLNWIVPVLRHRRICALLTQQLNSELREPSYESTP